MVLRRSTFAPGNGRGPRGPLNRSVRSGGMPHPTRASGLGPEEVVGTCRVVVPSTWRGSSSPPGELTLRRSAWMESFVPGRLA